MQGEDHRPIAVLANGDKPEAVQAAADLLAWLAERRLPAEVDAETAAALGRPELAVPVSTLQGARLAVVFGGDGTLLRAAKDLTAHGVPLLGVNLGRVGFLTAVELADLPAALGDFLAGHHQVDDRMMVTAEVYRGGARIRSDLALNDVVVKGPSNRVVRLRIQVGEADVAEYAADGVIISTPTGSTAYSLSAGGPIAHPNLGVLLITPICPHSLSARPLVVGGEEVVRVLVAEAREDGIISVDGQLSATITPGDEVVIRQSRSRVRLVRHSGYRFYDLLREKLSD